MLMLRETQVAFLPTVAQCCASHQRRTSYTRAANYAVPRIIRKQLRNPIEVPRCRLQSSRRRIHAGVIRAEISYIMVIAAPFRILDRDTRLNISMSDSVSGL